MPYQVEWEQPQSVLRLRLLDQVTFQEFVDIDRDISELLKTISADAHIALLVDANETSGVPRAYNEIKTSQTFATRRNSQIRLILIVTNNKLIRLMMLLIYNLCRPMIHMFDTMAQAQAFVSRSHRVSPPITAGLSHMDIPPTRKS